MNATVYAIRYAQRLDARRAEHFLFGPTDGDRTMQIDYFFWLVLDGSRTIVVDAAFTPDTAARRGREMVCEPVEALRRLGVEPDAVDDLVLTHLHYDHTGYVGAFPNARIWLQQREIHFWTRPHASRRGFREFIEVADIQYVVGAILDGRVRLVDGDAAIADSVSVHLVGGHTAGSQVVRVRTGTSTILLASDASHFYENQQTGSPYSLADSVPGMYAAFERMVELVDDEAEIVPGHDPLVMDRYPAAAPELAGMVALLLDS